MAKNAAVNLTIDVKPGVFNYIIAKIGAALMHFGSWLVARTCVNLRAGNDL